MEQLKSLKVIFYTLLYFTVMIFIPISGYSENLDISGIWKGRMTIIEKGMPVHNNVELMINQTGKNVNGNLTLWDPTGEDLGTLNITSGVLVDNQLSFIAQLQSAYRGNIQIRFDGSVSGQKIEGSFNMKFSDWLTGTTSTQGHMKMEKQQKQTSSSSKKSSDDVIAKISGNFILKITPNGGDERIIHLRFGDTFEIPNTNIKGTIVGFSPALARDQNTGRLFTYSDKMENPAVAIQFSGLEKQEFTGWILKLYPQTGILSGGHKVEFVDYREE